MEKSRENIIDFITIERLAKERKCSIRTILRGIQSGMYPPIPGNPRRVIAKTHGWPKSYWDRFYEDSAEKAAKTCAH